MTVSLAVNQTEQGLFCILHFQNNSSRPFYLNKDKIGMSGSLKSKIFIIKKGEEVVPYCGKMVKRKAPTADDFIVIQPSQSIRTSIRIDNAYEFSNGQNQYTAQYSCFHSSPEKNSKLNKLQSEIVTFIYDKK